MRIKRLEVIGFKSFCDRSVVHFNEPITAVVGPNGCGKSNIVDAIRWCMGEQSAKHLRGKAMDDVIFAGSESRGPLGMCEVTLVFENDGQVPLEYLAYSEIAVTRKLYRDGTSEYLLNKTPCRLRDITDFFLGTGIGAKAYSIIEQGRVGMIVSSKAEDRRFLIEEAAGITKYKVKKRAAEKKMELTQQNLMRISDVVAEQEKQLGSLRRQAQKAARYREYRSELKDLELWAAAQRWLGLVVEQRWVDEQHDSTQGARQAAHDELTAREAELEAVRLESAAVEQQLNEEQGELFALHNRIKLAEAESEHQLKQADELEGRAVEAEAEIAQIDAHSQEAQAALVARRQELLDAEALATRIGEELGRHEEVYQVARSQLAAVQGKVDEARGAREACRAAIVGHEGEERAAARRRDDLALRSGRLGEEAARIGERRGQAEGEVADKDAQLAEARAARQLLADEKTQGDARVAELKPLVAASGPSLNALRRQLDERRSRRKSLADIFSRYEGLDSGTRAVLGERGTRWGIHAPLLEVLQVPAALEVAVEAALHERLGAVLVESHEVGIDAIEFLKQGGLGRANFLALRGEHKPAQVEAPEGARRLATEVGATDEYRAIVDALLADVWIVDDLIVALDLWRGGQRHTYVTLDGELLRADGTMAGGSREQANAGALAQQREMRELDVLIAALEADEAQLAGEHQARVAELEALVARQQTLQQELHQRDIQILSADKDLARLNDEVGRIGARAETLAREEAQLTADAADAAREAEEATLALRVARDQLVALEDQLSQLGREQVEKMEAVEAAQEELTAFKIEVGKAEEKRRAVLAETQRLEHDERQRGERRERLTRAIDDGQTRARALREESGVRGAQLIEWAGEHARRSEAQQLRRSAYEAERASLQSREAALRTMRADLEALGEALAELALKRQRLLGDRTHLVESIDERYRLDISLEAHAHHLRAPVSDAELQRTRELRDLLDRMGEINLNAIEEYGQLETRHAFLVAQKTDLERALAQLTEAIDRINKTSKKRFREVFDLVNAKFQEIFPRCFRGGQARLLLTDEENLLESGIEIVAQPPGKKNTTVEVLSGGEKAMTAVALIFAIFLIKPSPFCLLDEVDAPLDEANVGRFNDLIREMTDRSQFIIITHNKRTMQIADHLYGVTMEEAGISKLVSVNLNQLGRDGRVTPSRSATQAA